MSILRKAWLRSADFSLILNSNKRSNHSFIVHVFITDLLHLRRWEGGDPGVSNQKTPTTILLTPDRKFHSFGYAARDFYHDLDPSESKHWLYLEKFKMKLHTTAVSMPRSSTGPLHPPHSVTLILADVIYCVAAW